MDHSILSVTASVSSDGVEEGEDEEEREYSHPKRRSIWIRFIETNICTLPSKTAGIEWLYGAMSQTIRIEGNNGSISNID